MPTLLQQSVAEFFGTAVMIAFGTGVVAQHQLLAVPGASGGATQLLQIHIGWGLAVTLGVLVSHRISGALLNPALMFGLFAAGKFPGYKLGAFALAQFLGGFAGAAITGAYYWDFLRATGTSSESGTSGIFVTSKLSAMSMAGAVVDETIATALLIFVVLAVADDKHSAKCSTWHVAGFVGALVTAIGLSFGAQTGYALNPARDFGPRAFCAVAGWGADVFDDNYWLVPFFAPVLGALVGGQAYRWTLARY
jgi:MIP family channel proteins